MNVYKYQIIKYLEKHNVNTKKIRTLKKDEIFQKFKHIDKSELVEFIHVRKPRQKIINNTLEKFTIKIDWDYPVCSI